MSLATNDSFWVFGYGSIIWDNSMFEPLKELDAKLIGAHREFNKKSIKSRGTKDKPGLALGLEYGGECVGKAFLINKSYWQDLKRREGGYIPIKTPNDKMKVVTSENKILTCTVFFTDQLSKNYVPENVSIEERAEIIRTAEIGENGNGRDYLKEINDFLEEKNVYDRRIKDLYSIVFQNK
ncbi:gamma-glutamylcyclotransferase [Flagellimonas sp.]|uniref:gamma-glutamylcyclotransferase n=1 Tax=Flagellimonas sp. TaxID=2058762 RepID=UPI003BA90E29